VIGGLRWLAAAALVIGALSAAPATAFADGCSGGPSAQNVYSECLPSSSGGKPTSGGKSTHSTAQVPVSSRVRHLLAHAKRDKHALYQLLTNPRLGATGAIERGSVGPVGSPSALGSAFDLGSGPTALLALLAATAVLLLGGSGWRVWRHRHHT
jgi:hypothetical protein